MTDEPELLAYAHGEALTVPVSDAIERDLNAFVLRHVADLRKTLEAHGMAVTDLLMPTWLRIVHPADVVAVAIDPKPPREPAEVERHLAESFAHTPTGARS